MARVLVSGASGFIGRALCARLGREGHTVDALSRRPESARGRLPGVADVHHWEPLVGPPPVEAIAQADAVVHLTGESVAGRWTAAKKQAIRDTRVLGTRNLVAGLQAAPRRPRVLVSASAIGYYGDRGDAELREDSSPGADFLATVCREWEAEALRAEAQGVRVVRLRTGIVLAAGGGALAAMLPPFKLGAGGPLGSGRQWWSWVHRDDVIGMIAAALADEAWSGPVNVTAPDPVRQREFARQLGRVLRRPAVLPAPAVALKLVLGGFSVELLGSKRVICARPQALGYSFRHPALAPALADAVAAQALS